MGSELHGRVAGLARLRLPGFPPLRRLLGAEGRAFVAVDLEPGVSLQRRLLQGPLTEAECVRLAFDLATALAAFHAAAEFFGAMSPELVRSKADGSWSFASYGDAFAPRDHVSDGLTFPPWASSPRLRTNQDLANLGHLLETCTRELSPSAHSERLGRSIARLSTIGEDAYATASAFLGELQRLFDVEPSAINASLARSSNGSRGSKGVAIRQHEISQLRALATDTTGPGAAVLRGATGSGKTYVIEELLAALGERTVLHGNCRQWDASPFSLVGQIMEGFLRAPQGECDAERLEYLRQSVGDLDQLFRPLSPWLEECVPLRGNRVPTELTDDVFIESLSAALGRLLANARAVVVIDDVQWIDEASRKLLKRIVDRADYPVLFVVTARSEIDDAVQAQRLLGPLHPITRWDRELSRLTAAEASQLVAQYLSNLSIARESANALGILSDGTPLGVLEVVRFVLNAGLLLPHWDRWELDVARVASLPLPPRALEVITRRIAQLSPRAIDVLQVASVLGTSFEVGLLEVVSRLSIPGLVGALLEAQRCQLIEDMGDGMYRFVHQSIVDALATGLGPERCKALHARAFTELSKVNDSELPKLNSALVFRLAHHAFESDGVAPQKSAVDALLEAGRRAFRSFDNSRALLFLTQAEALQERPDSDVTLSLLVAEAELRLGLLPDSKVRFERLSKLPQEPEQLAHIWSRIASIYESQSDSKQAWEAAKRAFEHLGEPFPNLRPSVLARLASLVFASSDIPSPRFVSASLRRRTELHCSLLFQVSRLASVRSDAGVLIAAASRAHALAEELGRSDVLARVFSILAFLQTLLGRRGRAQAFATQALAIAELVGDPLTQSHAVFVGCALAAWRDELDLAIELADEGLRKFRSWLTPQEWAITALNVTLIESIRGRAREAWTWAEKGAGRALEYEGDEPIVSEFLSLHCDTAARRLGVELSRADWLARVRKACHPIPSNSAYYLWTLGPRLRLFTERGEFGPEFDQYVQSVRELEINPKQAHLIVSEYYVHLSHAYVHRCLRATAEECKSYLPTLECAAKDLRASARLGLLRAHATVIEGYLAFFRGRYLRAERRFAHAAELASANKAPWVVYAVARGRAHLLRARGAWQGAAEQAGLAVQAAEAEGSVHLARWVREEFEIPRISELPPPSQDRVTPASLNPTAFPATIDSERHVQALLNIGRATAAQFDLEQQAKAVLDETLAALGAARGFLFLRASGAAWGKPVSMQELSLIAARTLPGESSVGVRTSPHDVLEQVIKQRGPVASSVGREPEVRQVIAAPLIVRDVVVGAVCLESAVGHAEFSLRDGQVLAALLGQVSFALELTRTLRERERLSEDLQQAQKMDAVGRLAGGIAHDFNNMLAAICVSVEAALAESPPDWSMRSELETIQGAAERATRLTRQLLAFSRRQVIDARPLDLNATVREIVPMLQRLLGHGISLETDLVQGQSVVRADTSQIEQILVNLAVNARDAMPQGGRLLLRTSEELVEVGQKPGLDAGTYAVLRVIDDGLGMDVETQRRVFEPFFTTKGREEGTGLGLATVYGIVRQSSGHIELDSAPGRGTEFRVFLPRINEAIQTLPPPSQAPAVTPDSVRVLLVDDEPLVRHAFRRTLKRLGYSVVGAASAREAIEYLNRDPHIDLIITDVIMPGMNGLEMIEHLDKLGIRCKVLYVSGYADGILSRRAGLGDRVEFMQKPIYAEALASKVEELLRALPLERPA
ncbi:MAG TPA: response regulator [Polyangiaceae bacterium]|nr:response regulator [Polyangiaceae bacterium]